MKKFQSFDEFYDEYIKYHQNIWNRRIHLCGWIFAFLIFCWAIISQFYFAVFIAPLVGLLTIWFGHYWIEPTNTIEFKYPLLTALANIRMFISMLFGKLPL